MTVDWKKKLLPNLPYLLFVYLFDKLCQAVRLAPGLDASEKFLHLSQGFTEAFSSAVPSLHPLDLLAGIAGAVIVRLWMRICANVTEVWQSGRKHWLMLKSGLQNWTPFLSGSMKIPFRENFLTSVFKSSPLTMRKSSISFKM